MNTDLKIEVFQTGELECNTILIYSNKTNNGFLIDPGENPNEILPVLSEKKINLKLLLHTHAHFDHIAASTFLKNKFKVPIYLNKFDRNMYENIHIQSSMFARDSFKSAEVDVYFENNFEIKVESLNDGNPIFKAIHTPGHTKGSTCFFTNVFGYPLLISGDTLFKNSVGRCDLPDSEPEKIIPSIVNNLLILPKETKVIPGHGSFTTIDYEIKTNPFLN